MRRVHGGRHGSRRYGTELAAGFPGPGGNRELLARCGTAPCHPAGIEPADTRPRGVGRRAPVRPRTRPVSPTKAGRQFMPAALQVTREDVRALAGTVGRGLELAATHVLSFSFLPAWLRRLQAQDLQLGMKLVSDHLRACEQAMPERQVQFLLCHRSVAVPGRLDRAGFVSVRIGLDRLLPVAAPGPADARLACSPSSEPGRIVDGTSDLGRRTARGRYSRRIWQRRCASWRRMATASLGCPRA